MKRNVIQPLIAASILSCLPPSTYADTKPMNAYTESAVVESRAGQVRLAITFHNRGSHVVYVPKDLAEEDELTNSFVEVRTADGEKIPYIGIKAKRSPPTADDYRAIGPQMKHVNTLNITPSFDFKPGNHRYVLTYEAHYLTDLKHVDKRTSAGVVRAEFTHAK